MASRALKIERQKRVINDTTTPVPAGSIENMNDNQIAARAYDLWQERGCPVGSPETDWFRAAEDLRDQTQTVGTAA